MDRDKTALLMAHELKHSHLFVTLKPAREGNGCIRVVEEQNPEWYQDLCAEHVKHRRPRHRKPDTLITRRETLAALERIAAGDCDSVYAKRLLPYVERVSREEN